MKALKVIAQIVGYFGIALAAFMLFIGDTGACVTLLISSVFALWVSTRLQPKQTPEGQEETGQQEVTGRTGLQEVSGETSLKEVPAGTGIQGTALCVEKEDDRGNRIYCLPLPCLVTFTKASFQVRYPLIARILEAESMELPVLSAEAILAENLTGHGISEENSVKAGPDKAAMQVQEVELRKMDKQSQIIEDPDPVKAVTVLAQRLFSEGIL